jgi:hypothetical protein
MLVLCAIFAFLIFKTGPATLHAMTTTLGTTGDKGMVIALALIAFWILMLIINPVIITITNRELRVKRALIPLFPMTRRIPLEDIQDIQVSVFRTSSSSGSGRNSQYKLKLLTTSGKRYHLLSGQTHRGTFYIEKTLKAMLAERGSHFPDCWKAFSA